MNFPWRIIIIIIFCGVFIFLAQKYIHRKSHLEVLLFGTDLTFYYRNSKNETHKQACKSFRNDLLFAIKNNAVKIPIVMETVSRLLYNFPSTEAIKPGIQVVTYFR